MSPLQQPISLFEHAARTLDHSATAAVSVRSMPALQHSLLQAKRESGRDGLSGSAAPVPPAAAPAQHVSDERSAALDASAPASSCSPSPSHVHGPRRANWQFDM